MVLHALRVMLQKNEPCHSLVRKALPQRHDLKLLVEPSVLVRGISASLRQASPGKEIKFTVADAAAINQLPQSGIHGLFLTQRDPQHDRCTTILTDRNCSLKHTRWKAAEATKDNA